MNGAFFRPERGARSADRRIRHEDGPRSPDGGSATILALASAAVVLAASALVTATGLATAARHHAAAVADAASLAAAATVDRGATSACERATMVARRNGAVLSGCHVVGPVVTVQVTVRLRGPLRWFGPVRLNSRAGPADTNMDHSGQGATAS
jgi:secretion/DNA translocation related TadE-like protein